MWKWRYIILVLTIIGVIFVANLLKSKGEVAGLISPTPASWPNIELPPVSSITAIPVATPISTPSSTPISSPSAKPKPKPTPKPLPTPSPALSSEVNGYIDRFSAQYNVDPNVLRHVAICESGFNSNATNYIYVGLYQFGSTTWKNIRKEIGEDPNPDLRYSAKDSVQTAAYAISKGKGGMWPNCYPK